MDAYPFCVFKRNDRPCFLVKFKDDDGNYLPPVSTKKKNKDEAIQVAFKWLRDGIPQKKAVVRVNDLSLKDIVRKLKTGDEVETIQAELRRLGWIKTYVRKDTPAAVDFISFLTTFWDWDTSLYINEKLRHNHGIHRCHCTNQKKAISLYWKPFFEGRFLGDITHKDIDDFIKEMGNKNLSASRKNCIIKAGTKPLRWAFSKGDIEKDPTREHILFTGEKHKRNILTPMLAAAAFRVDWNDDRLKIANMLASVTGMRCGEIVALRFQDLGSDCLYIHHSWNKADGLKLPKNNETRTVQIPFPALMNGLIDLAKKNPWGVSPDSFVFWSTVKKDVPMRGQYFVNGLQDALVKIGLPKDEASKYDFHGWRHFFTSYMVGKLDKKLLKSQTGHKTDDMIQLYSDHETVGDKEIIQIAAKETFAGIIPERTNVIAFRKKPLAIAACS